jgi:hypothetical protein
MQGGDVALCVSFSVSIPPHPSLISPKPQTPNRFASMARESARKHEGRERRREGERERGREGERERGREGERERGREGERYRLRAWQSSSFVRFRVSGFAFTLTVCECGEADCLIGILEAPVVLLLLPKHPGMLDHTLFSIIPSLAQSFIIPSLASTLERLPFRVKP